MSKNVSKFLSINQRHGFIYRKVDHKKNTEEFHQLDNVLIQVSNVGIKIYLNAPYNIYIYIYIYI